MDPSKLTTCGLGLGIVPGLIAQREQTVAMAPTISAYLNMKYQSGSLSRVITEISD